MLFFLPLLPYLATACNPQVLSCSPTSTPSLFQALSFPSHSPLSSSLLSCSCLGPALPSEVLTLPSPPPNISTLSLSRCTGIRYNLRLLLHPKSLSPVTNFFFSGFTYLSLILEGRLTEDTTVSVNGVAVLLSIRASLICTKSSNATLTLDISNVWEVSLDSFFIKSPSSCRLRLQVVGTGEVRVGRLRVGEVWSSVSGATRCLVQDRQVPCREVLLLEKEPEDYTLRAVLGISVGLTLVAMVVICHKASGTPDLLPDFRRGLTGGL